MQRLLALTFHGAACVPRDSFQFVPTRVPVGERGTAERTGTVPRRGDLADGEVRTEAELARTVPQLPRSP